MVKYQLLFRVDLSLSLELIDNWYEIKTNYFPELIEKINAKNIVILGSIEPDNRHDELIINVDRFDSINDLMSCVKYIKKKLDFVQGYVLIS